VDGEEFVVPHEPGSEPKTTTTKRDDVKLDPADPLSQTHGRLVFDQDEMGVGEVHELFVDPHTGRVRYLRIEAGGVLGFAKSYFLIPAEAVVTVDDKKVYVDLDYDSFLGAPSYLKLGQPHWDIPPKAPVITSDGEKIGEVIQEHPGFIVVERGVYFPDDCYVPNKAVAHFDGQKVYLSLTKDEVGHQGWDEAPPTLVRLKKKLLR
jgi:hypothetical protein